MAIWLQLKIDSKTCISDLAKMGSKTRQKHEVFWRFLLNFWFKTPLFCPELWQNCQNRLKSVKSAKSGLPGILPLPEASILTPEKSIFGIFGSQIGMRVSRFPAPWHNTARKPQWLADTGTSLTVMTRVYSGVQTGHPWPTSPRLGVCTQQGSVIHPLYTVAWQGASVAWQGAKI